MIWRNRVFKANLNRQHNCTTTFWKQIQNCLCSECWHQDVYFLSSNVFHRVESENIVSKAKKNASNQVRRQRDCKAWLIYMFIYYMFVTFWVYLLRWDRQLNVTACLNILTSISRKPTSLPSGNSMPKSYLLHVFHISRSKFARG